MLWKRNGDNRKDAPNPREKFLAAISNAIGEALDGGLFDRGATKPRHGLRALSFGLRSHRCGNNQRTMIVVSYLKPAKPCRSSPNETAFWRCRSRAARSRAMQVRRHCRRSHGWLCPH
jgi:hypothetical protein